MTSPKTKEQIRDEVAHSRAIDISKKYKPEEFTVYANARRSFIKGFDFRDQMDNKGGIVNEETNNPREICLDVPENIYLIEKSAYDLLMKDAEKLVKALCVAQNYLNWHGDDLIGDDCIGDQKLTQRFKDRIRKIDNALADWHAKYGEKK